MKILKPLLIFSTRHGTIPNITPSLLLKQKIKGVQFSVGDFWLQRQTLKTLPENLTFKRFLGFEEHLITYLTPYDSYKSNDFAKTIRKSAVKIKIDGGYHQIDGENYDEMIQIMTPDYAVTLTEIPFEGVRSITHKEAVSRTQRNIFSLNSEELAQNTKFLAPIHFKSNKCTNNTIVDQNEDIENQLQNIIKHEHISGLVFINFCQSFTFSMREETVRFVQEYLKRHNKQYIFSLSGFGKIQDVIHAIKLGFSLFQISWPFILAIQGQALIKNGSKYLIKQPQFSQILLPLQPNCSCFTCKNHSQPYISHLIQSKESNSSVLLSIHNLQRYIQLL